MTPPEIIPLIEKYLAGQASPEEHQAVLDWYRGADLAEIRIPIAEEDEMEHTKARLHAVLRQHIATTRVRATPLYRRAAAIAAILLLLAIPAWWLTRRPAAPAPSVALTAPIEDVLPGHNGAVLTLADGSSKVLDSLRAGVIAVQGHTTVTLGNGQVSYVQAGPSLAAVSYNTMSTPRGRQYTLILPDGSKVWLNAASSITYPTEFAGKERQVTVTGEAYFEVKHDVKSFLVQAGGRTIKDLGTRFNVNAYADEPVVTITLAEGAVSVDNLVLKPGQQATGSPGGGVTVTEADVARATAWKNGAFAFYNTSLPELLRQLSRWYDVDVQYQGPVSPRVFSGDIGRSLTLSQVLKVLSKSRIHYRIEDGTKLIILSGSE